MIVYMGFKYNLVAFGDYFIYEKNKSKMHFFLIIVSEWKWILGIKRKESTYTRWHKDPVKEKCSFLQFFSFFFFFFLHCILYNGRHAALGYYILL